ncbi:uncharacterized protein LOC125502495 [Dendroctonus ponderosae]|uniref:uncharacterized protein LOC125502495 n=1 Tax=Dendroctonus ponderosae TaxID=77166 RepID=UPI002034AEB2|nr:uncharacterized protein LOC125502495 [Dendroctonus ponderosae]
MDQSGDQLLKCEQPAELHGRVFVELEPKQICNQPVVVKLGIQDIQPFSVVVSWQSRDHSGVHGYQVAYYSVDSLNEVRGKILSQSTRSLKLTSLYPGTKYRICVLALGNWATLQSKATSRLIMRKASQENSTIDEFDAMHNGILAFLVDTATTRCTEVLTLGAPDLSVLQDHSMGVQSLLTRRLGLIVGCCLGFVVFVFLVSILGYLKVGIFGKD